MNEKKVELSKCCNGFLLADLDYNEVHYWSDVAEAPLFCEICGESANETLYWGAFCTIRFNDGGGELSGVLFGLETYDKETYGMPCGIRDEDVFFYANSVESLEAMLGDARGDFTLVSIDDWVTNG